MVAEIRQLTLPTELSPQDIDIDALMAKIKRNRKRRPTLVGGIQEIVNDFGERIVRVDGRIPPDLDVKNGDRFLFISYDQTSLSHGLHKYPAKFFPELPRWLIESHTKEGEVVLDPFSGSGTTNIEALLLRRNSVGIDIDPFSRFLAKVKVTPLDTVQLEYGQITLLRQLQEYQPSAISEQSIPVFPYRDNWYNKYTTLELVYLKKIIYGLEVGPDVRDLFLILFSSILRAVSKADDNCTRTVIRKKLNKKVNPGDALRKFALATLVNVPKMMEFSRICPRDVTAEFPVGHDARDIKYPENHFDLAVTSPPYANAVDYPRTHQLELYWLGLANGSLALLKKNHVGTESVSAADYLNLHHSGIELADEVLSRIYSKDPRRAFIAYKYIADMKSNLAEVYRVLKKGHRYIVVVGNNRMRGQVFENWRYVQEAAKQVGFKVDLCFGSEIIKHFIKVPREERINMDWVLILTKQ